MIDSFYLAWRYLRYHRLRTLLLVASLSLIGFVPAAPVSYTHLTLPTSDLV